MAEYIDRDDAVKAILKWEDKPCFSFLAVARDVMNVPAANVVERKHGKWINPRPDSEMCSACGVRFSISSLFAVGGNEEPNFCPNCGADMRAEEGE